MKEMLSIKLKNIFLNISNILSVEGDSFFKIRAYQTASEIIESLSEEEIQIYQIEDFKSVKGIGEAIAKKIIEYRETGEMKEYNRLIQIVPLEVLELLKIPNLWPKTLGVLWKNFKIDSREKLKEFLEEESNYSEIPNFWKKKVENILEGLKFDALEVKERLPYKEVLKTAIDVLNFLSSKESIEHINYAGSLRRKKDLVKDIDILIASSKSSEVVEDILSYPNIAKVFAKGITRVAIFTKDNRQVDLRIVRPDSYGSALQYFTGSREHNIELRKIAISKDLHLSEYWLFKGSEKIAGSKEEDIYNKLGFNFIPPEERLGGKEFSNYKL